MRKLNREEKVGWVFGLLMSCPFQESLENCPANEARELPLKDRIDVARNMEEHLLDEIIAHHQRCLMEREGKPPVGGLYNEVDGGF